MLVIWGNSDSLVFYFHSDLHLRTVLGDILDMAFNLNNCGAIREFQSVGQQIDKHLLKPDLIQSDRYVWTSTFKFDAHILKFSLTIKD